MTLHKILTLGAVSLGLAALSGCGGSSDSDAVTTENYNGPGSKWDIELSSDGAFEIERRATPQTSVILTVNGDYERYSSGFLGLTVTSASGEDAPSAGDSAWALEVPGYALLLKPTDGDQLIAMVTSGSCPSADINANWVIVKQDSSSDATDSERDYFGSFSYDAETGTPSLPSKYAISTGFPAVTGGGLDGSGSCDDGLMFVGSDPDIAAMYLTESGGAIVQTNINNEDDAQFIFALAQNDIADIGNLAGNYAGMLFDDNMADGSNINPVSMVCDDSGTCTGTIVTDISTGAVSSDSVTITLNGAVDQPENGFITGMISDTESNGNLVCMADVNANNSGKTIVNCVGQSPGDNTKMFNVMFVSI
jgi:hypothetical protein